MGGPGSGRRPSQGVVDVPDGGVVVTIPRRPVGLGDRGAREWAKVWTAGAGHLNAEQDYPWVEQACRAWDDIARYRARIRKDGDVQRGSQGQPVAHPLIAEVKHCEDTIRRCLSEIGFSPSARARLGLAKVRTASKLDELAAKRAERAAQQPAPPVAAVVVAGELVPEDEW